jgi:site-specific DNA-cytosine methylase
MDVRTMSHDLFSTRFGEDGKANTLARTDYKEPPIVCWTNSSGDGVATTIDASYYKGQGIRQGIEREYIAGGKIGWHIIRRLTPLECARLQGFPDWWTDGVEGSDSNIYKMWGNGIALPCAADVLGRIAKELKGETNHD